MPAPSVIKGSDHFFNVLYEGNGGGQRVGKFIPFTDNGTIDKSCIFNDGDGAYIHRTPGSDGNRRTWTWSAWVKRAKTGAAYMFIYSDASANTEDIQFDSSDRLQYYVLVGGSYQINYISNRTFEDNSKWYHIVVRKDTTQSTAADRVRIYVDGVQLTSWNTETQPSQNDEGFINQSGKQHAIGNFANVGVSDEAVGYMAEVNFADGTSYGPDTFGITDTSTGRWVPKSLGSISYGTHGYRMQFANTAGQTIGDDTSGQGNDYTVVNVATTDITTDSPTQNHATFDPFFSSSTMGLTEGNLTVTDNGGTSWETAHVGMPVKSGKWYFEATVNTAGTYDTFFGVSTLDAITTNISQYLGYADGSAGFAPTTAGGGDVVYWGNNGNNYYYPGASTSFGNGDIAGMAYDADTGAFWMAKNNTWISSGNPSNGTNPIFSGVTAGKLVYFGISNTTNSTKHTVNFGQKSFQYTPPTGFKAVQQDNLSEAKNDFADFVWIKNRDSTDDHQLYDSSRGVKKMIESNTNAVEETDDNGLQRFLNGGCAIDDDVRINTVGESYVSWNWHANGGTTAANTDGSGASIASTTQANQTAGFSIVTWTGTGSNGTVAHGLSSAPEWMLIKNLTASGQSWHVYHVTNGNGKAMFLDTNANVSTSSNFFNDTTPTNKVFTVGTSGGVNQNTKSMLAYCWHSVKGYSKFGTYTGGGGTDGTFTHLGFKPAWLLVKRYGSTGNWYQFDNARGPINDADGAGKTLMPNHTNAAAVQTRVDFLSNGFKQRINNDGSNLNSATYIYMAFAEHPFIGDGTNPATAR